MSFLHNLSVIALLGMMGATPATARGCGDDIPGVLFAGCAGETIAELALVKEGGVQVPDDQPPGEPLAPRQRVTITAAYTSGEKREPEGLFIIRGEALDPYPQGWDGVALIDGQGQLSLHHAERIDVGNERYDLRRKSSRRAFAQIARLRGWSAFQSHMLIIDGKVDTRPRENAPRFARRLLYMLADGSIGLFETPALTLHDAAVAIANALSPVMALNLDMGSYDYCRLEGDTVQNCGTLAKAQTGKLSNLLILSRGVAKTAAITE